MKEDEGSSSLQGQTLEAIQAHSYRKEEEKKSQSCSNVAIKREGMETQTDIQGDTSFTPSSPSCSFVGGGSHLRLRPILPSE
mmetsp:Transcript_26562/g.52165  ORF Transcript_26562/g.52165 Transcript_26562/m.52165 type:complete len:82 (+) Transcript_26562:967-1212(+)